MRRGFLFVLRFRGFGFLAGRTLPRPGLGRSGMGVKDFRHGGWQEGRWFQHWARSNLYPTIGLKDWKPRKMFN